MPDRLLKLRHMLRRMSWCMLWRIAGLATLALPVLPVSPSLHAANDEVTLNFVNADIESVVKAVSLISGRNFVLDPRVKGTINIVSGRPVSRPLAYQVLVSALRLQGFAVVENRGLTRILPEIEARVQAGPVQGRTARSTVTGEQIVTQVFPVRHESAQQVIAVLKPLVSPNQSIAVYPGSNALVITDTADNLQRLAKILAAIDVPHGDEPRIIVLNHASAPEVASHLNRLFGMGSNPANNGDKGSLAVVADARSNRLILRSDNPGYLIRARALITELDQPESGLGNIHVIPLKHAEAARVAQTLRAVLGGEASGGAGLSGATSGMSSPAVSTPAMTGSLSASSASGTGSPAAMATFTPPQTGSALQTGSLIQADTASNALIVTASPAVLGNLKRVIEMLDRRRAQVYIEALVVELTADKAAEFGIQWQDMSGLGKSGVRAIGGTNFGNSSQNIISASISPGNIGKGLNFGLVNGQITVPGLGTVTNLGLLARFLESEAQANILSTPNIMTLDNEEAKIVIGQNLPFVTGSYSNTGNNNGSVTPFQTYERKDVGLTLRVRPQITEGGVVRVQIYQEASSVQSGTASNSNGPITNKRSLESNVLVDDGKIIALGGLIEDSYGNSEERVPVLGSIPVLGALFRYENRNRKKTNLMVFLRPHIIRDAQDYHALSHTRYDRMRQAQEEMGQQTRDWLAAPGVPVLPAAAEPAVKAGHPLPAGNVPPTGTTP